MNKSQNDQSEIDGNQQMALSDEGSSLAHHSSSQVQLDSSINGRSFSDASSQCENSQFYNPYSKQSKGQSVSRVDYSKIDDSKYKSSKESFVKSLQESINQSQSVKNAFYNSLMSSIKIFQLNPQNILISLEESSIQSASFQYDSIIDRTLKSTLQIIFQAQISNLEKSFQQQREELKAEIQRLQNYKKIYMRLEQKINLCNPKQSIISNSICQQDWSIISLKKININNIIQEYENVVQKYIKYKKQVLLLHKLLKQYTNIQKSLRQS